MKKKKLKLIVSQSLLYQTVPLQFRPSLDEARVSYHLECVYEIRPNILSTLNALWTLLCVHFAIGFSILLNSDKFEFKECNENNGKFYYKYFN